MSWGQICHGDAVWLQARCSTSLALSHLLMAGLVLPTLQAGSLPPGYVSPAHQGPALCVCTTDGAQPCLALVGLTFYR